MLNTHQTIVSFNIRSAKDIVVVYQEKIWLCHITVNIVTMASNGKTICVIIRNTHAKCDLLLLETSVLALKKKNKRYS
jgi:hypothetical protein